MAFIITTATTKIAKLKKRIKAIPGGTSAGKTVGVLEVLIDLAQRDTKPTLTSVVSESFPHLRRGCIRDFLNIMEQQHYFKDANWNKSESTYVFETGSIMEFFSADQADKLRGGRRDRLFINECNNIPFDAFEQLEVRTKESIYLDWNPTNEFWYYTDLKGKRDDLEELTLTYLDNEGLSQQIIDSIEQRKNRKGWWTVYGLGMLGDVEGKIYKDWQIIDFVPHEARLERRGLDFGYSNDPSAIIDVYYYNGGYILDEVLYKKGQSNKQLADTIINTEKECLCVADSAEPKSIDEMKLYGVNILPAVKGMGSVSMGISFVQAQRISITKRSVNLIAEYRNYLWKIDPKNGRILNQPEGGFDHALDAVRYALTSITKPSEYLSEVSVVYH
jgi:phage terminase large subunit